MAGQQRNEESRLAGLAVPMHPQARFIGRVVRRVGTGTSIDWTTRGAETGEDTRRTWDSARYALNPRHAFVRSVRGRISTVSTPDRTRASMNGRRRHGSPGASAPVRSLARPTEDIVKVARSWPNSSADNLTARARPVGVFGSRVRLRRTLPRPQSGETADGLPERTQK